MTKFNKISFIKNKQINIAKASYNNAPKQAEQFINYEASS